MSGSAAGTVVVTGGQGFAGRHLVARWLRSDPDVRVVSVGRSPRLDDVFTGTVGWGSRTVPAPLPDDLRVADDRATYRSLDLVATSDVTDLLVEEGVDTVVHLAGSLRDSPFDALVRNNVVALQSLLDAIAASGRPIRLVLGSSGSVYGAVPPERLPVTEATPAVPIDPYSVTKRTAEDLASVRRRAAGLDVVVARIFNVIGRGEDERHLAPHLARQLAQVATGVSDRVEVGPLHTTRDFVDADDVAGALIAIAGRAETGEVVNVASGVESPTADVHRILAEAVGWDHEPDATRPARPLDMPRQQVDVGRLAGLGHRPGIDLATSLRSMLRYYLEDVARAACPLAPAAEGR